jgi:hypothetical protein
MEKTYNVHDFISFCVTEINKSVVLSQSELLEPDAARNNKSLLYLQILYDSECEK